MSNIKDLVKGAERFRSNYWGGDVPIKWLKAYEVPRLRPG